MSSIRLKQDVRIRCESTKNISDKLCDINAESLAEEYSLVVRDSGKFTIVDLLTGYYSMLASSSYSYDHWAGHISAVIGLNVSGQAVHERAIKPMIAFMKKLLIAAMSRKCQSWTLIKLFDSFSQVLIQDATHFSLPRKLSKFFPGSHSRHGAIAMLKVQAILDLSKGNFLDFSIASFRDNDQKDAPRIAGLVKNGGLIIRDLGYNTIPAFKAIVSKGGHFLSRSKYGIVISDYETGERIDLGNYLKKKDKMDAIVFLGAGQELKCRMVAISLDEKIATERVRKAKNDRHSKSNHSQAYYELLRYSIYLTSVTEDVWSSEQVAMAYRHRWYIEILFKGWKSGGLGMKFNIPDRYATAARAEFFFYANLILITLLVMPLFLTAQRKAQELKRTVSILKLCSYIKQHLNRLFKEPRLDRLLDEIVYYCCYDKRKTRLNSLENLLIV